MQASPASNEVRLPRAIVKQSARIQDRIATLKAESEDDPAALDAADPADPQPPTPPAPPADPRETDPAYWKQRFQVTQGFLTKERNDRAEDVAALTLQLTELQEQVRSLQAGAQPALTTVDVTQFMSAEQIEALGEEEAQSIVAAALKVAQSEAQKLIEREIKPLRDARKDDATRDYAKRKQIFVEAVAAEVPDYEEIDKGEAWLAWLAERDEATGLVRQEIMNTHVRALDAPRVAALFLTFKATQVSPTPPVVARGSGANSGDAPAPPDPGLRPLRPGEAKAFYTKAALGKVTDAERKTFEARKKLTSR